MSPDKQVPETQEQALTPSLFRLCQEICEDEAWAAAPVLNPRQPQVGKKVSLPQGYEALIYKNQKHAGYVVMYYAPGHGAIVGVPHALVVTDIFIGVNAEATELFIKDTRHPEGKWQELNDRWLIFLEGVRDTIHEAKIETWWQRLRHNYLDAADKVNAAQTSKQHRAAVTEKMAARRALKQLCPGREI